MKNIKIIDNRGIFFTLAIVLLIVPLALLVAYYSNDEKTRIEDDTAKIRCDELHYFVEDVKRDLNRAVIIFGRRAAIYAIDHVVRPPGNPLENYTFGCTSACNIDCNRTEYPLQGSEAAIAELGLCGTLNNTNVTYMINHTIREWVNRIEMRGAEKNFGVRMTINKIAVVPIDPWDFSIIINSDMDIRDDTGICYFQGFSVKTVANTSIIGLEDPLYTLSTGGNIVKYIYNCEPDLNLNRVAGCSDHDKGGGDSTGTIVFYSTIAGNPGGLNDYCMNTPASTLGKQVLVLDQGSISCTPQVADCLNMSSPSHFAGFIEYNPSNNVPCGGTIPWLSDTGDIDKYHPENPPRGLCSRTAGNFTIADGDCVYIENKPAPENIHQVKLGIGYVKLNLTCYTASNASFYAAGCASNYSNGPSFFDRLDGRYNLSEKYVKQASDYFNNTIIGMETLVDLIELGDHNINPHLNASSVDYLYWKNVSGDRVCGVCDSILSLRMDCQHAKRYGLNTGCS